MVEGVDPGVFSGPRRDSCAAISRPSAVTGSCRRRGDKRSAESAIPRISRAEHGALGLGRMKKMTTTTTTLAIVSNPQ